MLGVIKCASKDGVRKNIGDPVQTLAALQFTGDDALLLEREQLDVYDGPEVDAIMNAYYMHDGRHWPPSDRINPLMVSIHINPSQADAMLDDDGVAYFKRHEPIGCRDKGTQRLLEAKGVQAYFSGCLTLTLGKSIARKRNVDGVCFVDPYFDRPGPSSKKAVARAIAYITSNPGKIKYIKRLARRMTSVVGSNSYVSLIRAAAFYRAYSTLFDDEVLLSADYITHSVDDTSFTDEREKLRYAEDLLKKYAAYRYIVTSRIHCALPCVGIGVPVVFINAEHFQRKVSSRGRFDGNLELFNTVSYTYDRLVLDGNFKPDGKLNLYSSIPRNDEYKLLAEDLDRKCVDFVRANQPRDEVLP